MGRKPCPIWFTKIAIVVAITYTFQNPGQIQNNNWYPIKALLIPWSISGICDIYPFVHLLLWAVIPQSFDLSSDICCISTIGPNHVKNSNSFLSDKDATKLRLASDQDHRSLPTLPNSGNLKIIQCFHLSTPASQNPDFNSFRLWTVSHYRHTLGLINYFTTPLVV